jgi:hypothetical protein
LGLKGFDIAAVAEVTPHALARISRSIQLGVERWIDAVVGILAIK